MVITIKAADSVARSNPSNWTEGKERILITNSNGKVVLVWTDHYEINDKGEMVPTFPPNNQPKETYRGVFPDSVLPNNPIETFQKEGYKVDTPSNMKSPPK